jgi:chromosome segregation ATPase
VLQVSFLHSGAEVTIHIKNGGEEAFRKEEFGKTIIITRRFSKEGASTWKIMNQDKKVISTKREDLAAICDHMNIQVDNPMNVLTQGACFYIAVVALSISLTVIPFRLGKVQLIRTLILELD